MFRSIITFVAIFLASTFYIHAQLIGDIMAEVGKQPLDVVYDEELQGFHVFCLGYDANFDGEKTEENEENPSWWFITLDGFTAEAEKKHEFPFNSLKFPFRPAIQWNSDEPIIYIPHPNKISSYNMRTFEIEEDGLIDIDVSAIETSGETHLFLTINDYIDKFEVQVYSLTMRRVLQTIDALHNPAMSLQYQTSESKTGFAVLNEGFWGENNSVLQLGEIIHMGDFELDQIELGDLGNHLHYDPQYPDKMFVTVNGSDKIEIIDLINQSIENTIFLEELASPRETITHDDMLFISTYSELVYAYDGKNYKDGYIRYLDGYSEGMAVGKLNGLDLLAVSLINNSDYSPNNKVVLLPLNATSVSEKQVNNLEIYPNPATDYFHILNDDLIKHLEIIDSNGRSILKRNDVNSNELNINNLQISNGVYYIKAVMNGNSFIKPLIIRK